MVKKYKVAYPVGFNLDSQMFDTLEEAKKFSSGRLFGMVMKLVKMNESGSYSWAVCHLGIGWYVVPVLIIWLVYRITKGNS